MRRALFALGFILSACGPLGPNVDGGMGGGGFAFGGGTTTGGGASSGGGSATGGGGANTGGGTPLTPLTWNLMGVSGATSTSYVIGLSGDEGDLWAVQDTGGLFHATTGAFQKQFAFQYGAIDLFASGGTVVMIQTRTIRTCTAPAPCTQDADFQTLDLLNSGMNWNLFGEALCGTSANHIAAVVSDTNSIGQLFEWDGTQWTRTLANLGLTNPHACWFDPQGRLFISGEDGAVMVDQGAATPITLSANGSAYYRGMTVAGTNWLVGVNDLVARGQGATLTPVVPLGGAQMQMLRAAGGLDANEVFAVGYWVSTNAIGSGFKWDGTSLKPLGATAIIGFGSGSTVRVIHRVGSSLYFGGGDSNAPLITRARR